MSEYVPTLGYSFKCSHYFQDMVALCNGIVKKRVNNMNMAMTGISTKSSIESSKFMIRVLPPRTQKIVTHVAIQMHNTIR